MTDSNGILSLIFSFFRSIYDLGDQYQIFGVSINSFFIALAIMSIILTSLVNFAKSNSYKASNMVSDSVKGVKSKFNKDD